MQLAARRDVEVHALFVGQPGHGAAQEGLGGVGDTVPPGRDRLTAGMAQVVLVVDEERCAELLHQLQQVDPPTWRWPFSSTDAERGRRCRSRGAVATSWSAGMEMQDTAAFAGPGEGGEGPRRSTSTIVPCSVLPPP